MKTGREILEALQALPDDVLDLPFACAQAGSHTYRTCTVLRVKELLKAPPLGEPGFAHEPVRAIIAEIEPAA